MGLLTCKSSGAVMCCEPLAETITPEKPVKLQVFSFQDLESATNGFSRDTYMGKGSHGSVYKGTLKDGKLVAVKRRDLLKHEKAFNNEIRILSTLHSERFVNLVGFSKDSEHEETLLVVDFMPNGTLHDILHCCPEPLTWAMRAHLALQIARSVNALHSASPPVIHRDIKSVNVLIDGRWNAKLGDFGLALRGHIEDVLKRPAPPEGTVGYIDPAYESTPTRLSTKSDVFSFGVLLLELISGREAVDARYKPLNVIDWALPLIRQGKIHAVFDPKISVTHHDSPPLKKFAAIAAQCVGRTAQRRPSMALVTAGLEKVCARVPLPEWVGLARVMKRSHNIQGPELPPHLKFSRLSDQSSGHSNVDTTSRDSSRYNNASPTRVRTSLREAFELPQNTRDDYRDLAMGLGLISIKDCNSRDSYYESSVSYDQQLSKDYSRASNDFSAQSQQSTTSHNGNQREQTLQSESRELILRKLRRDSRESSRDHLRESPQHPMARSRPGSREPSRENSREWSRDQSERSSTDLPRDLTRDVVEASLNHIRKWRNRSFDQSKRARESSANMPSKISPDSDKDAFNWKRPQAAAPAAASQMLPTTFSAHRRNKSDGSISFSPDDFLSSTDPAEGPANLKKRSSSGRSSKKVSIVAISKTKLKRPVQQPKTRRQKSDSEVFVLQN